MLACLFFQKQPNSDNSGRVREPNSDTKSKPPQASKTTIPKDRRRDIRGEKFPSNDMSSTLAQFRPNPGQPQPISAQGPPNDHSRDVDSVARMPDVPAPGRTPLNQRSEARGLALGMPDDPVLGLGELDGPRNSTAETDAQHAPAAHPMRGMQTPLLRLLRGSNLAAAPACFVWSKRAWGHNS